MKRPVDVIHNIAEMVGDLTRSLVPTSWASLSTIRYWGGPSLGLKFWPTKNPNLQGTQVNYDFCRQLYSNQTEMALGSAFAKPIVDLQVGFMGMPRVATENDAETQFLNECIEKFWTDEIQQGFIAAIRDSKCVIRISKPDIFDPLMTLDEARHGVIEILPPERVDIEYNPRNKRIIERAVIRHTMLFVDDEGDPASGRDPVTQEHDVLEIIDRESYKFFDQTTHEWLTEMESGNAAGFVPLLPAHNEWDAALQSGQSDLETVIPFIRAFHDVITQGLQAHGYHSTPKVVMNLEDVAPFIKNNFPDAVDPDTGELKQSAEISWRGREILFLQVNDKVQFLEAKSILGDTKILAEFLIDCICIASQTPEWAFMRVDSGSANSDRNAQTVPFVKKIERKRRNFNKVVQELCKMILVLNGQIPTRPSVSWEVVRADDQVVTMQAFQQLVMGLEVARQRGEISDATYQNMLRGFLPVMGSNTNEKSEPDAPVQGALPPAEPSIKSGA
jgi:hypothetical protein